MQKEYLKRNVDADFTAWAKSKNRKPLLVRGARQIGKSSAIRELSKLFEYYIEIDFEKRSNRIAKELFEKDLSIKELCDELSIIYNIPVVPEKTLLFLDEIQSCLPAISSLRYFYEEMPDLHVVAAGSLLEFALQQIPSFGVGRIHSLFMTPFSFSEFLQGTGKKNLHEKMMQASPEKPLSETTHKILLKELITFIIIGGMPEVVAKYAETKSIYECQKVLDEFINTLDDDFSKYKDRVPASRIRDIFETVLGQMGRKYMYSNAAEYANIYQIKDALNLLKQAGIIYSVTHSSANGIPLAAEKNPKYTKYLVFDTGVYNRYLQMDMSDMLTGTSLEQINKGAIAELFAGLELVKSFPNTIKNSLFYWQREQRNSNAEVDFLLNIDKNIIPLEIKSGTKGSMQSMFLFMKEKNVPYGIRSSLENFGQLPDVKIIPLYAISQWREYFFNTFV
ncbi:MAG: AAA family ATPase [Bacteroidales bacterium]|nr:AAA family ATPase [Bacteroidales bacterium]